MYEYAPWTRHTLNRTLTSSSKSFPILDLQFGGYCNLNCVYCDTIRVGCPCSLNLTAIERILNSHSIQWVYGCGLGELTANGNVETFKHILTMCKKLSIKVSIFSNILEFDDTLLDFIDNGTLYVIFKLDSFKHEVMNFLYGISSESNKGQVMLANYQRLKEVVHINDGTTNLAASIVPTSRNYAEIYQIIDFCIENNIYPLMGQLENAGKGAQIFDELKLSKDELMALLAYFQNKYGVHYEIPICPATISGIHITNSNRVIIDERTGLSCGWFWLDEPKMIEIGNIIDMSLEEITSKIIAYRKSKLDDVISIEKSLKSNPFGGCGGDAKRLLQQYISVAKY